MIRPGRRRGRDGPPARPRPRGPRVPASALWIAAVLLALLAGAGGARFATLAPRGSARTEPVRTAVRPRRPNRDSPPAAWSGEGTDSSASTDRGGDIAAICSRLEASPDPAAREECYCGAVARWMAANSHQAGPAIGALEVPPPIRLRLEAQLLAERDFASAYEWADRLPDAGDRAAALGSVLYEASLDAPRAVLEFAQGSDLGEERDLVLGTLFRRWSREDPRAAADWLEHRG